MLKNDRIWQLLARKLSNEATQAELDELSVLLKNDEATASIAHTIEEHWNANPDIDIEFLDATYLLHLKRMQKQGLVMGTTHQQ